MHTNTQLHALESELAEAQARLHRVPVDSWQTRPAPGRWSAGEHVVHLTLTTRAFLPLLEEALRNAPAGNGPYKRDFIGWMLYKVIEPPARIKVKTTAQFEPPQVDRETAFRDFDAAQDQLSDFLRRADGRALDKVKIVSPFDGRVRYSAWSALRILAAHQRRHLWIAGRGI